MSDVTFKYKSGGKDVTKLFKWADRKESRETPEYGVWKLEDKAWKIYARKIDTKKGTDNLTDLSADYRRAEVDGGLPVGKPQWQEGDVTKGSKTEKGFALVTEWMTGYNFQKDIKPLSAGLKAQNISHVKTSADYTRIKKGCEGAKTVGLTDCQGFVQAGISEPIKFIDIHTSWNPATKTYRPSERAQKLVDEIVAWGTQ